MTKVDRLLLCSCAGSQAIDPKTAGAAIGAENVITASRLCEAELDTAGAALAKPGTTVIACGQMAALFADLAEDVDSPGTLRAIDIRDRAGWSDAPQAHAKQAALLAEGVLTPPPTPVKTITSDGVCLILGGEEALDAARRLEDTLAVTCLLDTAPDLVRPTTGFDIALGRIRAATGSLGAFSVTVDGFAPIDPAGRGAAGFKPAQDNAASACDIILDLRRGAQPLFSAHHKRDGYVKADPGDPAAVARAVFEAADLVGEFEKPLYVRYDASICAHSRARQPGCDRCLLACPTGAITSAGDMVAIDPGICAGCGACAAVCPTGAASFDDPPAEHLFRRLSALASAYRQAGGTAPRLLVHDTDHGAELIQLSARYGRGLPADVLPLAVANLEGFGHAEILAGFGVGFGEVVVLMAPKTDRTVPDLELALAGAILTGTGHGQDPLRVIAPTDPDGLEAALFDDGPTAPPVTAEPILAVGGRRDVTRLAATALAAAAGTDRAEALPLPAGAPYGALAVNRDACTLCLACVSLCPTGALADNPEKPQLRFQESACVQCGICAAACPEDAITLAPQLDLTKLALEHRVLNEQEPFACIECGALFGVKATIEKISEKLAGKHWMFTQSDNVRLIQMCDDCRVRAQYHGETSPFRMGERPRIRTTEDELKSRDRLN